MPAVAVLSDAYREYARRLIRLSALIAADDDDSREAERIREEMDVYWSRLDSEEVERLRDLSVDLYAISDAPQFIDDRPTDREVRREIDEAVREEDWQRLRSILADGSRHVSAAEAFHYRAFYWFGQGDLGSSLGLLRALMSRYESAREYLETEQASLERWLEGLGILTDAERRSVAYAHGLGRSAIRGVDRVVEGTNDLMRMLELADTLADSHGLDARQWTDLKAQFLGIRPDLPSRAA